jgi:carbon storage regulator
MSVASGAQIARLTKVDFHVLSRRGNPMLVLTRKIGEEIIIDGRIRVTVTQIKGDKVRLGIDAPAEVPVDRQEVHERRRQFAEPDAVVTERPAPASNPPKALQPR